MKAHRFVCFLGFHIWQGVVLHVTAEEQVLSKEREYQCCERYESWSSYMQEWVAMRNPYADSRSV
jgi:hypothetical protein